MFFFFGGDSENRRKSEFFKESCMAKGRATELETGRPLLVRCMGIFFQFSQSRHRKVAPWICCWCQHYLSFVKVVYPLLVDRAVSLIVEKRPDLLNMVKDDGFSALHLASLNGHFSAVSALIEVH